MKVSEIDYGLAPHAPIADAGERGVVEPRAAESRALQLRTLKMRPLRAARDRGSRFQVAHRRICPLKAKRRSLFDISIGGCPSKALT